MKLIFLIALGVLAIIFCSDLFNKGYRTSALVLPCVYILLCMYLYLKEDGKSDD